MKRSAELTPLSHDHHQSLFVAVQLKRAADAAPGKAFLDFHAGSGSHHFEIEETILLPRWFAGDPDADRDAAVRTLTEHLQIRAAAARMQAREPTLDELHGLGQLLQDHVRFEERELFPMIEAGLDERALAELGTAIAAAEAGCSSASDD